MQLFWFLVSGFSASVGHALAFVSAPSLTDPDVFTAFLVKCSNASIGILGYWLYKEPSAPLTAGTGHRNCYFVIATHRQPVGPAV